MNNDQNESSTPATATRGGWPSARTVVSLLALAAGAAMIVYGTTFHTETVVVEREIKAAAPTTPAPPPSPFFSNEPKPPPAPPVIERVEQVRSESYLMRLAALGALERLPSGQVLESEPKAFCPT
jgi:hypothetical protein